MRIIPQNPVVAVRNVSILFQSLPGICTSRPAVLSVSPTPLRNTRAWGQFPGASFFATIRKKISQTSLMDSKWSPVVGRARAPRGRSPNPGLTQAVGLRWTALRPECSRISSACRGLGETNSRAVPGRRCDYAPASPHFSPVQDGIFVSNRREWASVSSRYFCMNRNYRNNGKSSRLFGSAKSAIGWGGEAIRESSGEDSAAKTPKAGFLSRPSRKTRTDAYSWGDSVLVALGDAEFNHGLGLDLDGFTGLRIASHAGLRCAFTRRAEPRDDGNAFSWSL